VQVAKAQLGAVDGQGELVPDAGFPEVGCQMREHPESWLISEQLQMQPEMREVPVACQHPESSSLSL